MIRKEHLLDECLEHLLMVFRSTPNKYEAHLKCYPTLHRMADNIEVIHEVFRRNILNKNAFTKSNCTPDFQLTLLNEPECFLFVNFFGPNKDCRTDISYSTMHHHDDYLLSTINAKGDGYKSLIFQQGYEIDKEKMTAKLELEKYVKHTPRHIEFIDCHTAHTIFYPESTTMTYGLWSTHHPTQKMTKSRNIPFVQKNKELIKKGLKMLKVSPKQIGVQQYREDYFFPGNGIINFLEAQVSPPQGSHYTQNFFNIAQGFLEFSDKNFLKDFFLKNKSDEGIEKNWLEKLVENEEIPRNYDSYEMYTPKRNVNITEYQKIYEF